MITEGSVVIAYLQDPKEKIFGLLLHLGPEGIVLRGMDLGTFHDWKHQQARQEELQVGPVTCFYPMHRLQRMELDERLGSIPSLSQSFLEEAGFQVTKALQANAGSEPS